MLEVPDIRRWHDTLIFSLVDAVERHPLARRLLAGLEPHVTARVLEIPALNELRTECTQRLRTGQTVGAVRPDIDPVLVGNVYVNFTIGDTFIDLEAGVDTVDRTGVEMEALTAVTVAAFRSLVPREPSIKHKIVGVATSESSTEMHSAPITAMANG